MTIRQMLLAATTGAVTGSKISYKGYAAATADSISLPTHAASDTIIVIARSSVYTPPTIPAGWTAIGTESIGITGFQQAGCSAAYKVAAGSSEVSDTWTGAGYMLAAVYDGVASVGTATWWEGGSTTTWSGITVSDPESWVVGLGFFFLGIGYDTPPTGMTHRGSSNSRLALNDTASPVSAWNVKTTTGTYAKSGTYVLELVSE